MDGQGEMNTTDAELGDLEVEVESQVTFFRKILEQLIDFGRVE